MASSWIRNVLSFLLYLVLLAPAAAHSDKPAERSALPEYRIEIAEKLGGHLPLDAVFLDERGNRVMLRDFIRKPAIIAPVYFSCTHSCPMLLGGLAEVIGKMSLSPGHDYQVVAVSFDERDTPKTALDKKSNYLKAIGRPFPQEQWRFLTGDIENIRKLTDAAGFAFRREEEGFSHPMGLIIISPDGKIVRYLHGFSFLPFDLSMAITEAAEGRVGSAARRVVSYCYSYDPVAKTYVFNVLRVVGVAVILFAGFFLAYLVLSGRRGRVK